MVDRAPTALDDKSSEPPMRIVNDTRSPVMAWRERHIHRTMAIGLPISEFVHAAEPEIMNEIPAIEGNHDRLIRRHFAQSTPIQVIEVRMGHEHEVDIRKMGNLNPGPF